MAQETIKIKGVRRQVFAAIEGCSPEVGETQEDVEARKPIERCRLYLILHCLIFPANEWPEERQIQRSYSGPLAKSPR